MGYGIKNGGGSGENITPELTLQTQKLDNLSESLEGKGVLTKRGVFNWYKYTSENGNYLETVVSNMPDTYPEFGQHTDGFWYEKQAPNEPMWLTTESGELIAPIYPQKMDIELPTATASQIDSSVTAFTARGLERGSGKVVKKLLYGSYLTRFDAGNNRYYADIQVGDITKISAIHAVANGVNGEKVGLTITLKKDDDPLGYIISTFSTDDATPVQTEHVITDGVLRLEAFGSQYTKINYLIFEEN